MKEISNKVLLSLLFVTIAVSLVGTLVSLNKIGKVYLPLQTITGAAAGTGTTTITIQGTADIQISDSVVNFSTGYYNASCTRGFALLESYGAGQSDSCWLNTSGSIPPTFADPQVIINNGTVAMNVTAEISTRNASVFLCGTGGCPGTNTSKVEIASADIEAGSCGSGVQNTYVTLANDNSNVTVTLCQYLNYQDTIDSLNIMFNLTIPFDVDQGMKSATITYTGTVK